MLEDTISSFINATQSVVDGFISTHVLLVFLVAIVVAYILSQLFVVKIKFLARVAGHYGDIAEKRFTRAVWVKRQDKPQPENSTDL